MDRPEISVILPVHNEEAALEEELRRITRGLEESGRSFEIVLIDDASTDASGEIAREAAVADPRVKLISFAQNRGVGWARREGTRAASGDVVVWTDADLTYPNEDISRLVKLLDGADQVIGARATEEGTIRPLRRFAKWAARRLASYLVDEEIPDLNSGFRAFRRDAIVPYLPLLPRGFSCVSTATLAFMADGRPVHFETIPYRPRTGHSKFHPLKDSYRLVMQVLGIALYYNPMRAFLPLAGLLSAAAAAKLGYDLIVHPFRVAGITLLLFLAAFNVLAVGLLADVVVRARKWPRPE